MSSKVKNEIAIRKLFPAAQMAYTHAKIHVEIMDKSIFKSIGHLILYSDLDIIAKRSGTGITIIFTHQKS